MRQYLRSVFTVESFSTRYFTRNPWAPYIASTLMVMALTLLFWWIGYVFTLVNIGLLYLLPVFLSAVRYGRWPSFYTAVIGVVSFDLFFVPPLYTFTVNDARYLLSFAVYLAVATFTANLATRLREQANASREREAVTSALFNLSTQIAASRHLDTVLHEMAVQANATFNLSLAMVLPNHEGNLVVRTAHGFSDKTTELDGHTMKSVYRNGRMAGHEVDMWDHLPILYVPLKTDTTVHGVMCVKFPPDVHKSTSLERIVQALAGLASVTVARIHFEEEAKLAHLTAESERIRTALLDSISHELKTPLATIIGSATALLEEGNILSSDDRQELLQTVREGSMRMNRLVTNLLGMVRLESGMLSLHNEWCDAEDLLGVALQQLQDSIQNREVEVQVPDNLPPIWVDDVLIEQALVNLLSNAVKYSPMGSPIRIHVMEYDGVLTVEVRDFGPGIQDDEADKVFDKFYRSQDAQKTPGTGLGLAIAKGIITLHGGEIAARNAKDGGAIFTIRLPVGDDM